MKIALPEYDVNIGSQRIPFLVYKNILEKTFSIQFVSYKKLGEADVVFVHSDLNSIKKLRRFNKTAKYIIFKPHQEIPLTSSGDNFLKRTVSFFRNLYSLIFKNRFRIYNDNLKYADLIVSDTPRLNRFYNSKGYNSIYCPLIDYFDSKIEEKQRYNNKNNETFNILYTGNLSHFKGNIKVFLKIISNSVITKNKKIVLNCLTGISKKDIKTHYYKGIKIVYEKYSLKKLKNLLFYCDLGWVPNRYMMSFLIDNPLIKLLFTNSTQYFDKIFLEKFSANAGRCILFAQYGIPFITNPNEESVLLFGKLSNFLFYETDEELTYLLQNYDNLRYRNNVRNKLINNFNYLSFSKEQATKLYEAIILS
tara:strand:+ start:478 stop:1569 length:1092 start_codon:yes stop_codon:yes gene_type:complete